MKKFNTLKYSGLALVGVPVVLIVVGLVFILTSKSTSIAQEIEVEVKEVKKIDTVYVEKKVIVRDTIYIKPKPQPVQISTQDSI